MSDRELLEMAAKAAGVCPHLAMERITPGEGDPVLERWGSIPRCRDCKEDHASWNPLADDGDALRLVGALNLDIYFNSGDEGPVVGALPNYDIDFEWPGVAEAFSLKTRDEAIRRTIVRAAAEIGRQMP